LSDLLLSCVGHDPHHGDVARSIVLDVDDDLSIDHQQVRGLSAQCRQRKGGNFPQETSRAWHTPTAGGFGDGLIGPQQEQEPSGGRQRSATAVKREVNRQETFRQAARTTATECVVTSVIPFPQ
jgi:hypothetical protein